MRMTNHFNRLGIASQIGLAVGLPVLLLLIALILYHVALEETRHHNAQPVNQDQIPVQDSRLKEKLVALEQTLAQTRTTLTEREAQLAKIQSEPPPPPAKVLDPHPPLPFRPPMDKAVPLLATTAPRSQRDSTDIHRSTHP
ncbi:MAG: hypothetical protein HQL93_05865 [Magnetococcales bacterium]|nr:hypothetical protein [Magnetococcales bacterium]